MMHRGRALPSWDGAMLRRVAESGDRQATCVGRQARPCGSGSSGRGVSTPRDPEVPPPPPVSCSLGRKAPLGGAAATSGARDL